MISLNLFRTNFCILFLTLCVSFPTNVDAQRDIKTVDDAETKITNCNQEVKVFDAYDLTTTAHFFLLADKELFKRKTLTNVFSCISKTYPKYIVFQITVFSDKKNLEIAVDNYLNPPLEAFPPVVFGDRPAESGYYRANFYRYNVVGEKEYFEYSSEPNSRNEIKVLLKSKKWTKRR